MTQGLDRRGEQLYNDCNDRMFWLAIREALLMAVRAIEDRHGLERSKPSKREEREARG